MSNKDKYIRAMDELKFKEISIDEIMQKSLIQKNHNLKFFYKTCVSLAFFQTFFLLISTSSCYCLGGV